MTWQQDLFAGSEEYQLFLEHRRQHPIVYRLFCRFALQVIDAGHERFSARAIFHRIRWETYIDPTDEDYKVNDRWSPYYARLFETEHAEHEGFFVKRTAKADGHLYLVPNPDDWDEEF